MGILDTIEKGLMSSQGGGGGQLQKAMLIIAEDKDQEKKWSGGFDSIEFLYNPETISVVKKAEYKEHETQGSDAGEKEWTHGVSRSLTVSDLYFDTYETRENVREQYINRLEKLVHRDPGLDRPPKVRLVWGAFMNEADDYNVNKWYVTSLTVNYTMFLNNGTPVRAKVTLELKETNEREHSGGQGHNHSRSQHSVHTVRQGQTLQDIAADKYGDPGQWRKIAEANNIDDPTNVPAGQNLKIPPK